MLTGQRGRKPDYFNVRSRLKSIGKANILFEKPLANYMKDHFAGSVAALELLNHLNLKVGEQSHARAASWKKREQKFGKSTDEKEAGKG